MNYIQLVEVLLPALIAAIVGGLTIWLGAKQLRRSAELAEKQIAAGLDAARLGYHAQVIAATRKEWLQELRSSIASAITEFRMLQFVARHPDAGGDYVDLKELMRSISRIQLLLDPADPLFQSMPLPIIGPNFDWKDQTKTSEVIDALGAIGATLQKREWAALKESDLGPGGSRPESGPA